MTAPPPTAHAVLALEPGNRGGIEEATRSAAKRIRANNAEMRREDAAARWRLNDNPWIAADSDLCMDESDYGACEGPRAFIAVADSAHPWKDIRVASLTPTRRHCGMLQMRAALGDQNCLIALRMSASTPTWVAI